MGPSKGYRSILCVWKLQAISLRNRHVTSQTCPFVSVAILPQLSNTFTHFAIACQSESYSVLGCYFRHVSSYKTQLSWWNVVSIICPASPRHITFVYKFAYRRFSFAFNIYIAYILKSFSSDIKHVKGYLPWSTEMAVLRVPTSPKHEEDYLYTNGWKRINCLHSQGS